MEGPFRRSLPPGLTVIETLRLDPAGPVRGERHLARMARTARDLGIAFDRGGAAAQLRAACGPQSRRARLTLAAGGTLALSVGPIAAAPPVWRLRWAAERVRSDDPWRRVKTSRRGIYDRARAALPDDAEEVLFLNERGEVAEGAITTIFAVTDEGLLTPPVRCGALPGILREELIAQGRARERVLRPADLVGARLCVGNSLRGLLRARLVPEKGP